MMCPTYSPVQNAIPVHNQEPSQKDLKGSPLLVVNRQILHAWPVIDAVLDEDNVRVIVHVLLHRAIVPVRHPHRRSYL